MNLSNTKNLKPVIKLTFYSTKLFYTELCTSVESGKRYKPRIVSNHTDYLG